MWEPGTGHRRKELWRSERVAGGGGAGASSPAREWLCHSRVFTVVGMRWIWGNCDGDWTYCWSVGSLGGLALKLRVCHPAVGPPRCSPSWFPAGPLADTLWVSVRCRGIRAPPDRAQWNGVAAFCSLIGTYCIPVPPDVSEASSQGTVGDHTAKTPSVRSSVVISNIEFEPGLVLLCGRTDGWMDGQTDGWTDACMPVDFVPNRAEFH